jgi:GntR family transcriptional regulator
MLVRTGGVNHNTLFRALRQLRDEGLLEFQRSRGITVVGAAPGLSEVVARCRELLGFSIRYGYRKDEVLEIIAGL